MSEIKQKGNALLCYFWGETERPDVVVAKTLEEVGRAIVKNWTGDDSCPEFHDTLREIKCHDFTEDPVFDIDFEIGGVRFEDVVVKVTE